MIRLAANLTYLFTEAPFLERFQAAAWAGFRGIEYLFPYDHAPADIARALKAHDLTQVLFNAPAGDWVAGERGFAALPGYEERFRASIEDALPYIDATEVRLLHVMAGLVPASDRLAVRTYLCNLEYAARRLFGRRITILIEPLNARDAPGYFLSNYDTALALLKTLDVENVRLQFDIYHRQIIRGDVTTGFREALPRIGHIQIASVPDRHEPDRGELSLSHFFGVLEELRYDGWVGCEYRPVAGTEEGLPWMTRWARPHGR